MTDRTPVNPAEIDIKLKLIREQEIQREKELGQSDQELISL